MKKTNSTKAMIMTGMFAAVLAVISQIQIPMPSGVPITLQIFAAALAGFVLGWRYGMMTTVVYVLTGAFGLPVFTGFKGGIGSLTGPTGGFIFGFIALAVLCGMAGKKRIPERYACALLGILFCHMTGILFFSMVMKTSIIQSAMIVSIPYLPKDMLLVFSAYFVAQKLKKRLAANGITIQG